MHFPKFCSTREIDADWLPIKIIVQDVIPSVSLIKGKKTTATAARDPLPNIAHMIKTWLIKCFIFFQGFFSYNTVITEYYCLSIYVKQ